LKKIFLFLFFVINLYADIYLNGYIHVGDNYFDNYKPTDPIAYKSQSFWGSSTTFIYNDYPTNFYLSSDVSLKGIELVDAIGIEPDSNIKIYIDGNLVATGGNGSNIIYFSSPLNLDKGYHTIYVRGSCYRRGRKVSCNRRRVDNDDFYFSKYRLITNDKNHAINFIQRFHIGDSDDDEDYYDDLSDTNAMPFWYPDSPFAKRGVEYDFQINCNTSQLDFNITSS